MGIIKRDEVRGYMIDGEICCLDCFREQELSEGDIITENMITEKVVGEDFYFCDNCEKAI